MAAAARRMLFGILAALLASQCFAEVEEPAASADTAAPPAEASESSATSPTDAAAAAIAPPTHSIGSSTPADPAVESSSSEHVVHETAAAESQRLRNAARHPLRINKYVAISSPRRGTIGYTRINGDGTILPLVDRGLRSPQGLVMDNKHRRLYVADPASRKIWGYTLLYQNGWLTTDGRQDVVVNNVEARWVDVDLAGSLFFTDEAANSILRVDAATLEARDQLPAIPIVLYNGIDVTTVSSPGGIAADNYNLFWTNKVMGDAVGSVVKGLERLPVADNTATTAGALSRNAPAAYGLCITSNNIFYMAPQQRIYGVKKTGGAVAVINDGLGSPRGCAWDGDGTIFVSDKSEGKIFSFAGNMQQLNHQHLAHVADFEDAFGVTVISGCARAGALVAALVVAAAMDWGVGRLARQ